LHHLLEQLEPVHAGHLEVGADHVDFVRPQPDHRFLATARGPDVEVVLQQGERRDPYGVLIVDDEDVSSIRRSHPLSVIDAQLRVNLASAYESS
jgi:hypothetical protein